MAQNKNMDIFSFFNYGFEIKAPIDLNQWQAYRIAVLYIFRLNQIVIFHWEDYEEQYFIGEVRKHNEYFRKSPYFPQMTRYYNRFVFQHRYINFPILPKDIDLDYEAVVVQPAKTKNKRK